MRGSIKKRSNSSWTIVVDLDRDPVTGKRKQKRLAVRGPKQKAEAKLTPMLK